MIEVEMTKDIKEYDPKIIGPFSMRQIGLIILGLCYAVPLAIFLPFDITTNLIIATIAMTPVIICAFVNVYGMHAEQFFVQILRSTIIYPRKRRYKVDEKSGYMKYIYKAHKKPTTEKKKIKRSADYPAHR